MLQKFILLISLLVMHSICIAQFFTVDDAPCPRGDDIQVDTVLYVPTKALPFDRCFLLKYVIPAKEEFVYFAVTPVDKRGGVSIRCQDYKVFMKSGYSVRSDRRKAKRDMPYKYFKKQFLHRLHPVLANNFKGKSTEVLLFVPPLTPGREYKITLIRGDVAAADTLVSIGNSIFEGSIANTEIEKRHDRYRNLRAQYDLRFNSEYISEAETMKDFREFYRSHSIKYSLVPDPKIKEFRLYYVHKNSHAPTRQAAASLSIDRFIRKTPGFRNYSPSPGFLYYQEQFILSDKTRENKSRLYGRPFDIGQLDLKDTDGNVVDFSNGSAYDIYLMKLSFSIQYDSYINDEQILYYKKLGTLSIDTEGSKFIEAHVPDALLMSSESGPYSIYKEIGKAVENVVDGSVIRELYQHQDAIKKVTKQVNTTDFEKLGKTLQEKDDLLRTLSLLIKEGSSSVSYNTIANGEISFKDPYNVTKPQAPEKIQENLKLSLKQIDNALEFTREYRSLTDDMDNSLLSLIQLFEKVRTALSKNRSTLVKISELDKKLRDLYIERFNILETDASSIGSTSILDFVSEAKFRIVPDFGLLFLPQGILERKSASFGIQDITPYVGANINFRALDKNIKFKDVRYKSLRHYLSLQVGITLRSLAIADKRSDLFSDKTLVTGIGIRFSNNIKLIGSGLFFKANNLDPLGNGKPIRVAPSIGISVDYELKELLGDLKSLFKI